MSDISLPYGGSGLPYNGGKEPYTPRKKKKADGGALLMDRYPTHYMPNVGRQVMADGGAPDYDGPTLPIPDRLPNWGDVSKAVDVAKSFLTPPDPYEAAGKMVTQARGGDYGGALETGLSFMPQTGALYERKLSPMGFYSHGAESAYNLPQETMTVQQARKMLEKTGTKPDEFRWSGFETAYPDPMAKVNRADLVRHFEENAPQLGETSYTTIPKDKMDKIREEYAAAEYGDTWRNLPSENRRRIDDLIMDRRGNTKFSQYTLPGGESYREVLTTLREPERTVEEAAREIYDNFGRVGGGQTWEQLDPRTQAEYLSQAERNFENFKVRPAIYKSSHWDEPNVLAHLRMSERPGNVLHLEELQSDWGQEARKKGIRDQNEAELANLVRQREALSQEALANPHDLNLNDRLNAIHDRIYDLGRGDVGVPDAPYISSTQGWTDLGLKRALYEAAKANAERLAWTPGAEQAARYDLSKQVSRLHLDNPVWHGDNDVRGNLIATGLNGEDILSKPIRNRTELEEHIGKDAAKNLVDNPSRIEGRTHILEGNGLQVGGEGMKGYYDKILPSRLQALLKRLGIGSPEFTPIPVGDKEIPSMAITPEMRERLLKGLPYFASGGEVSAPITGGHTITMDDLIGRAPAPASTPGAYTDTGGQKIAAPFVTGMSGGYPVYSAPEVINKALNVASQLSAKKPKNTGTPVYSLAGA